MRTFNHTNSQDDRQSSGSVDSEMAEERHRGGVRRYYESKPDDLPYSDRVCDPVSRSEKHPIFNSWFYTTLSNGLPLPAKHPISSVHHLQTKICKYICCFFKPKKRRSNDLTENSRSQIYFWKSGSFNDNTETIGIITHQLASICSLEHPNVLISPHIHHIMQHINQSKKRLPSNRIVVHYIAHDFDNIPKDGLCFSDDQLPMKYILEVSGKLPIFVIERDNAGSLLNVVKQYAQEKEETDPSKPFDATLFFSCSEGEQMPKSADYPIDLFTSCLTSPSRMALIWHSRNYFCFQSGCLQPLRTLFFEEINKDSEENTRIKQLLEELKTTLKAVVESMALEVMDPEMFVEYFRTNQTLSNLCINFILACRILNSFNVHPVSYPSFPDFNDYSQWNTFDLRLDATLYLIQNKNSENSMLSYHYFMSQTLLSMENFIKVSLENENDSIPCELSFFHEILNDKDLFQNACDVLAKYLDSSQKAVYNALFFPIPQILLKKLMSYSVSPTRTPTIRDAPTTIKSGFGLTKNQFSTNLNLANIANPEIHIPEPKQIKEPIKTNSFFPSPKRITEQNKIINFSESLDFDDEKNIEENIQETKKINPSLLFSIIKILSYYNDSTFLEPNNYIIDKVLLPALNQKEISHLVVILLALVIRDAVSTSFAKMLSRTDLLRTIQLNEYTGDSQMWLLRFFSYAIQKINDNSIMKPLLDTILKLIDEANPELQITIICTLSGFIRAQTTMVKNENQQSMKRKKKIEKDVVQAALKFSNSASFIVRRELLLLLKKYKNNHQAKFDEPFENQKPFYKSISEYINQCKTDPNILVREAINSDSPSFIFDTYVSVLLKQIYPLMSTSLSLSSILTSSLKGNTKEKLNTPIKNRPQKRITREITTSNKYSMKISTFYKHSCSITSNLASIPTDKYVFGDKNGCITVKTFDSAQNILKSTKIANSHITDVQYSYNDGWPLIFSASNNGNCYCTTYDDKLPMNTIASFQLLKTEPDRKNHIHIAIDDWYMRLYSYVFEESKEFHIRDLRSDKQMFPLRPKNGPTMALSVNSKLQDIIALCGHSFEVYDLRASQVNPQFYLNDELYSTPFMLHTIDDSIPIFAIAFNDSSVSKIDMRFPNGFRTSTLYFTDNQTDHSIRAFAACNHEIKIHENKALMTAIGHAYGITVVDLENGKQKSLPQVSKTGTRYPSTSAIVFHPKLYSIAFVHEDSYIFNTV